MGLLRDAIRVRATSLLCSLPYSNYYGVEGKTMCLTDRFFCRKILCNAFTIQNSYFYSGPYVNKVSLYLRQAKLIDSIRLSLRSKSQESLAEVLNDPALDCFVVTNALRSAPSPDSALLMVETLKSIPHFSHTQNTLYALAMILAKSHQTAKLRALIKGINSGKFVNVVRVSFMDRMRWFAAAGDLDEVLCVWSEWQTMQERPCTESYNIIMGICAQTRKDFEAVKTFRRMIDEGGLPNARTYTVIVEHLVNSGKLDSAMQIFQILPLMRIRRTLRQYSVLVEAFTDTGQFDMVKTLLYDMRMDGILPGRAMHSSLQRMKEAGFVEETTEFIKQMLPDERIKHINLSTTNTNFAEDDDCDEDIDSSPRDAEEIRVQLRPWFDPAALAGALKYWRPEEVSELEDAKFVWTTRLVSKMIRSFRSAETAWQFFSWVSYQPAFCHDIYTISRMLSKLAREGKVDLVDQLLSKTKREGLKLSFSTIRLIIDFYGYSRNGEAALKVFHDSKALCDPISKNSLILLYSSLLRTLTKCKMQTKSLDIVDEMILCGIVPDIQTFSGLMHHFAVQGDIKIVQRLVSMVKQSGIEPDAYMFKVLISAYCKCERAALALRVFEDMRNLNLMPDAWTKQFLVKSLWNEGKLREAAAVEEKIEEITDVLPHASPGHLYTGQRTGGAVSISFTPSKFKPEVLDILNSYTHLVISIPPVMGIGDPMLQHSELLKSRLKDGNLQWLCYLSSTCVYGNCGGAWVNENYLINSTNDSGRARLAAENSWLNFGHELGLAAQVLRLGCIYGPGRSAIDTLIKQKSSSAVQRMRPRQYISRVHVSDICRALYASISKPSTGKIYNIVDDEPAPSDEIFTFARNLVEKKWPGQTRQLPYPDSVQSLIPEASSRGEKRVMSTRMKNELGVQPLHPSYRSGLQSILEHMETSLPIQ